MTPAPIISIAPNVSDRMAGAVEKGGGNLVELGEQTRGLIWNGYHDADGLTRAIASAPNLAWVQLPSAGIEEFVGAGLLNPAVQWTSAKGAYAKPVAEHALTLALAVLRVLPERIQARTWGTQKGTSLYGQSVTIVGGGGIAQELIRLLSPFDVSVTIVRRSDAPVEGAARTVTTDRLLEALTGAQLVFLATALTSETSNMIGAEELAVLAPGAVLINVARGGLIDNDALIAALESGQLSGAGVDVTTPEPLPDGHALWSAPNLIITPHTADTPEMIQPLLADRVARNVRFFGEGITLDGVVDPELGY